MSGKRKGGSSSGPVSTNSDRKSGKGAKKHPKMFDPVKRRLVTKPKG